MIYDVNFKSKLIETSGYEFQKLFFAIMKGKYGDDFVSPRPQGILGDMKNDGYIPNQNTYFAVYGPDTLEINSTYVKEKLLSDYNGLISKINSGYWKTPINKFVFVINTKHVEILPTSIVQKCDELNASSDIEICLWTSYDLKTIFFNLSDSMKRSILNIYYPLNEYGNLNSKALNIILDKAASVELEKSKIDNLMQFDEKILFNNISECRGISLTASSYSIVGLDKFLDEYDKTGYVKEQLSLYIKQIYLKYENQTMTSDETFDKILSDLITVDCCELSGMEIKCIKQTALVIMAKYFENCTIFKKRSE